MGGKNKSAAEQCNDNSPAGGNVGGGKNGAMPCKKHWLGVRVEDEDGVKVTDIEVYMELTDGNDYTFNLGSQKLTAEGAYKTPVILPDGTCKFGLPEIQDVEWWPKGEQPAKVAA